MIGVLITFIIAAVALALSKLPYIGFPGPMILAIMLAVALRHWFIIPDQYRAGIDFSAKKLLQLAIVLYGFHLNVEVILSEGPGVLMQGMLAITISFLVMLAFARWLKADWSLSLLLAAGTGICGAAAIAAVSPIIKANKEDTALAVGMIALAGTIFALIFIGLEPFLTLTKAEYGSWVGLSLHEIAHVAAAAAPAGEEALATALLAKLGRVLLLIPVCIILALWMNRKTAQSAKVRPRINVPWFLVGFVLTSLLGTYVPWLDQAADYGVTLATFLLTAAMVGLGLNIHLKQLRGRVWRPLSGMLAASIMLAVVSFTIF